MLKTARIPILLKLFISALPSLRVFHHPSDERSCCLELRRLLKFPLLLLDLTELFLIFLLGMVFNSLKAFPCRLLYRAVSSRFSPWLRTPFSRVALWAVLSTGWSDAWAVIRLPSSRTFLTAPSAMPTPNRISPLDHQLSVLENFFGIKHGW